MKFEIVSQIFDSSGYSSHGRQLFKALAKTEDVKLTTGLIPDWLRHVNDKELEAIKKEWEYDRIRICVTHPTYWRVNLTNKRNWVYCVWEGDKVPDFFITEMLNPEIEYVLVPSTHVKEAILRTASKDYDVFCKRPEEHDKELELLKKIRLVPHGVNHELFKPCSEKNEKFTFLVNKGWRNNLDRGGTQYSIKAFAEEFKKEENVRLIVKINTAYGVPDLDKLIQELGVTKDCADIIINATDYEYKDIPELYNNCDCFVNPTRAEGFSIPTLEAMACGKACIFTDFGGQTDFAVGWAIDYDLVPVEHELSYEGISWAIPNRYSLRKAMREAFENRELTAQKGQEALEKSKSYSWDKTAELIKSLVSETGVPSSLSNSNL